MLAGTIREKTGRVGISLFAPTKPAPKRRRSAGWRIERLLPHLDEQAKLRSIQGMMRLDAAGLGPRHRGIGSAPPLEDRGNCLLLAYETDALGMPLIKLMQVGEGVPDDALLPGTLLDHIAGAGTEVLADGQPRRSVHRRTAILLRPLQGEAAEGQVLLHIGKEA